MYRHAHLFSAVTHYQIGSFGGSTQAEFQANGDKARDAAIKAGKHKMGDGCYAIMCKPSYVDKMGLGVDNAKH